LDDDSKNIYDLFGLSEIDKIQEEIEKDLNGETAVPSPDSEESAVLPDDTYYDLSVIEPVGFYRETIKPPPQKSWAGAAAALFFICTLGTGMLGFGIGSGWAYFLERNEAADTKRDIQGEFTGTSYVFEPVVEEFPVATLSDMLELVAPSVVGITTYREEIPFDARFASKSFGSGIIFEYTRDRIFIATNLYVVRSGFRWDISIAGSDPISAYPVGDNRAYDLAVLYVYRTDLAEAGIDSVAFASFGDSDEARIGDVVLAIGNAMGEGTSVTRGIISAPERPVHFPDRREPLYVIQTDAAINYGNSGGPLVNTKGEIIGININHSPLGSSSAEGMGYSIASNVAAPVLKEIAENYRMPAIGIIGISLADDVDRRAELWGIPEFGALVISVQDGRPAYNAGILPNDVITSFDGQPIFDMPQLQAAIRAKEIGDIVEVRILRSGNTLTAITTQVELAMMVRDTF
jgi:S1-C subfamily serine protease